MSQKPTKRCEAKSKKAFSFVIGLTSRGGARNLEKRNHAKRVHVLLQLHEKSIINQTNVPPPKQGSQGPSQSLSLPRSEARNAENAKPASLMLVGFTLCSGACAETCTHEKLLLCIQVTRVMICQCSCIIAFIPLVLLTGHAPRVRDLSTEQVE